MGMGKKSACAGVVPAGEKIMSSMLLSSTISLSGPESLSFEEISTDLLSDESSSKES